MSAEMSERIDELLNKYVFIEGFSNNPNKVEDFFCEFLSDYYSNKHNKNISVCSIYPFQGLDLTINNKGDAYLEYTKNNPTATEEDFENYYYGG